MSGWAAAVYKLHDGDRRVIYTGVSKNPRTRLMAHSCGKPWWPKVAHVSVAWYPTREAALVVEAMAIQAERPIFNMTIPDPRRPSDALIPVGSRPVFPDPAQVAAMGPVWRESDVTKFLATERKPGRKPKEQNG